MHTCGLKGWSVSTDTFTTNLNNSSCVLVLIRGEEDVPWTELKAGSASSVAFAIMCVKCCKTACQGGKIRGQEWFTKRREKSGNGVNRGEISWPHEKTWQRGCLYRKKGKLVKTYFCNLESHMHNWQLNLTLYAKLTLWPNSYSISLWFLNQLISPDGSHWLRLEMNCSVYRSVYIITSFFCFSRKANDWGSRSRRGRQGRRHSNSEVLGSRLPRPSGHLEALWNRGTDVNII